jgi:3'-5' exoribonuclease
MISDMKAGQTICQPLIVRPVRAGNSSNGGVFVRGTVEDNSGSLPFISFEAKIVDKLRNPDRTKSSVYLVSGKVDLSKYARDSMGMQIVIDKLEDLRSDDDISMLIPCGNFNMEQYKDKLATLIGMVKVPTLRSLLQRIFNSSFCERFYRAPAGMKMHHAYMGGLLQHTVDVAELAVAMAQTIGHTDTDLVIAGALLHDIGKVKEISSSIGFPYTTEGKLLGHISLSVMMVREAAAELKMPDSSLQQLEHIILSHHGDRDKGSPMECVTREAFIVHYADEVNAIMNQFDTADGKGQWCNNFMLHRDLFIR